MDEKNEALTLKKKAAKLLNFLAIISPIVGVTSLVFPHPFVHLTQFLLEVVRGGIENSDSQSGFLTFLLFLPATWFFRKTNLLWLKTIFSKGKPA